MTYSLIDFCLPIRFLIVILTDLIFKSTEKYKFTISFYIATHELNRKIRNLRSWLFSLEIVQTESCLETLKDQKKPSSSSFCSSRATATNTNFLFGGEKDETEAISLAYESVAGGLKVT